MIKMIRRYKFFVFLLMISACNDRANIELPPHVPKLVVHSYVETGTYFDIIVGRTFPSDMFVIDTQTYVRNATVVLYENGIARDTLEYYVPTRHYTSATVKAVAGNTYRITVTAPGFEPVEATSYATFPVPTNWFRVTRRARTSDNGQLLDDITFTFADPASEQNYYLTIIERADYHSACIYTYDPSVEKYQANVNPFESSNSCIYSDEVLFNDRHFNGTIKEITLSGHTGFLDSITKPNGRVDRAFMKRCNISRELYQYVKEGATLHMDNIDPFTVPVNISTNVKNGYGLFAVYSAVVDTIR